MAKMYFIKGRWITVESVEDIAEFVSPEVYLAICGPVDEKASETLKQMETDIEELERRINDIRIIRTEPLEEHLLKMRDHINPYI